MLQSRPVNLVSDSDSNGKAQVSSASMSSTERQNAENDDTRTYHKMQTTVASSSSSQTSKRVPLQRVNKPDPNCKPDPFRLKRSDSDKENRAFGIPVPTGFVSLSDQFRQSGHTSIVISSNGSESSRTSFVPPPPPAKYGYPNAKAERSACKSQISPAFIVYADESEEDDNDQQHVQAVNTRAPSKASTSHFIVDPIAPKPVHDDEDYSDYHPSLFGESSTFDISLLLQPPSTLQSTSNNNQHNISQSSIALPHEQSICSSVCSQSSRLPLSTIYANHDLDDVTNTTSHQFDVSMQSASKSPRSGSPSPMSMDGSMNRSMAERTSHIMMYSEEKARSGFHSDKENETEEGDTAFATGAEEVDFSSYYTAAPLSDKEAHLEPMLGVPEYLDGVIKYLMYRQNLCRPHPEYMRKQTDLTQEMRSVLVDWIIDVGIEYNLHLETMMLAIGYIDLCLSARAIPRQRLQLVGTAATLLAAKYEEIYPPEVSEFVYITDDTYTKDEVLRMERSLLRDVLVFNCSIITPLSFLSIFTKIVKSDGRTRSLAYYLAELSLLHTKYLKFRPNQIAGAAVCLANLMTGPIPWPEALEQASQMSIQNIYECMKLMLQAFKEAPTSVYKASYAKYSEPSQHSVALLTAPEELPPID